MTFPSKFKCPYCSESVPAPYALSDRILFVDENRAHIGDLVDLMAAGKLGGIVRCAGDPSEVVLDPLARARPSIWLRIRRFFNGGF